MKSNVISPRQAQSLSKYQLLEADIRNGNGEFRGHFGNPVKTS